MLTPLLFTSLPNLLFGEGSYKQILVQSLGLEVYNVSFRHSFLGCSTSSDFQSSDILERFANVWLYKVSHGILTTLQVPVIPPLPTPSHAHTDNVLPRWIRHDPPWNFVGSDLLHLIRMVFSQEKIILSPRAQTSPNRRQSIQHAFS